MKQYKPVHSGYNAPEDRKEFDTYLQKRLEIDPNDYEALFALAQNIPKLEERLTILNRILSLNPTHTRAIWEKIKALEVLIGQEEPKPHEKIQQCTLSYKQIIELCPERPGIREEYKQFLSKNNL
jgi:hypothetical protein